jgi:hypothetical protein
MIAIRAMTNHFTQDATPEKSSQLAGEWMDAQSELSTTVEGAGGQGARAAETGRLAPASGGQDREEERLSDVQTSQDPLQLLSPLAQHYRTSQGFYDDCKPPLQPFCDRWRAS